MDDDAPRVNNSLTMPHKSQSLNHVWAKESLANKSTFMNEAIEREVEDIEVD
jgi:predicted DNA-binding protein